jgi:hypothetical protein
MSGPKTWQTNNGLLAVHVDKMCDLSRRVPTYWSSALDDMMQVEISYRLEIVLSNQLPASSLPKLLSKWSCDHYISTVELDISVAAGTDPENAVLLREDIAGFGLSTLTSAQMRGVTFMNYNDLHYLDAAKSGCVDSLVLSDPICRPDHLPEVLVSEFPRLSNLIMNNCTDDMISTMNTHWSKLRVKRLVVKDPIKRAGAQQTPLLVHANDTTPYVDFLEELDLIGMPVLVAKMDQPLRSLKRLHLINVDISLDHLELLLKSCPSLESVRLYLYSANLDEQPKTIASRVRLALNGHGPPKSFWDRVHVVVDEVEMTIKPTHL